MLRITRTILCASLFPILGMVVPLLAGACGGDGSQTAPHSTNSKVRVVTTTAILADFVRSVGGDRVEVKSIVPPGADVHTFQPTPGDSVAIGDAQLIVSIGLGLDDFLDPVLRSARNADAVHLLAARGLAGESSGALVSALQDRKHARVYREVEANIHLVKVGLNPPEAAMKLIKKLLQEEEDGESNVTLIGVVHDVDQGKLSPSDAIEAMDKLVEEEEQVRAGSDPHVWLDPVRAEWVVSRIIGSLIEVDPNGTELYNANGEAYIQRLEELDQEIKRTLDLVPPGRRQLVTFHDAFTYFGERYGWEVTAFVPGDASDATPGAVVEVMDRIGEEGIPAVFAEPQFSSGVLEQAAKDAGVTVAEIYSGSLDATVPTYIEMMRFNARSLAENVR